MLMEENEGKQKTVSSSFMTYKANED